MKNYNLSNIPSYRHPLLLVLIKGGAIWEENDGYDTPENIDKLACEILDTIHAQHMLESYHAEKQAQELPEHHD